MPPELLLSGWDENQGGLIESVSVAGKNTLASKKVFDVSSKKQANILGYHNYVPSSRGLLALKVQMKQLQRRSLTKLLRSDEVNISRSADAAWKTKSPLKVSLYLQLCVWTLEAAGLT